MLCHIVEGLEKFGWEGRLKICEQVRKELPFLKKNMRSLNGYRMRAEEGLVYHGMNEVELFTDMSYK